MAAEPPLVTSIVGTRPEAIKMLPVIRAIAARGRLRQCVILTGQHGGLAPAFAGAARLRELGCDPAGRSAARLRETLHRALCRAFALERPALVLVHGDTASAIAGAFAATDCRIAIGHVEAGLRSGDYEQPWPEEGNRVVVDTLSTLLFAPTQAAAANLKADGRIGGMLAVTGNTGIDALFEALRTLPPVPSPPPDARRRLLVTCHRRENQGEALAPIASALRRIVAELPLAIDLPLHPNRHVRAAVEGALSGAPHIRLHEPLGHGEMVALLARSWAVLTDSGGLQEEGAALGKPVLVMRNLTERPEAAPNIALTGRDPERIFAAVARLDGDAALHAAMSVPNQAFGDGCAGQRIALHCEAFLARRRVSLRGGG